MLRTWVIILTFWRCVVVAERYLKNKERPYVSIQKISEIPTQFEVTGYDNAKEFHKYVRDINALAEKENFTVVYKVKVEIERSNNHNARKPFKNRPKKYLIPLKKKSMKMSSFEAAQRRIAEEKQKIIKSPDHIAVTTPRTILILTTRIPSSGKYKPELRKRKGNYTKYVKPVRNRVITLTQ